MERLAPRARAWLARLVAGVMAAIVSVPAVADARPLEELLRMPFEQLLQLQTTERRVELAARATRRLDDVITGGAP